MVRKKHWEKSIKEFVQLTKNLKKKETVTICNQSFEAFPDVFSPIYSCDTKWFSEKIIRLVEGKKFLEIGSGTGIIACLAAIHGAKEVMASDINPQAIQNIHRNIQLHGLNIQVKEGDTFDPIPKNESFDLIFWNHPFYYTDGDSFEDDFVSSSVCDNRYRALNKFFQEGKKHLSKNGKLLLGTSIIARLNLIKKIAKENGYTFELLDKVEVPIYKGKKLKMDLRILSFERK